MKVLSIVENLNKLLEQHACSDQTVYVAYSGGLDSHVLLHACASLSNYRKNLTAVYVHHGLQALADEWEQHCAKAADNLGVKFISKHVNARAERGQSPEEAARNARYQALGGLLKTGDLLLLAQHQDDQLETVLLQLFRGAGLKGLAGMPTITPLGQGWALRPFLNTARNALEAYASQNQLEWVEDPTNQSYCYDRNYLRHAVLPLLKQRWPQLARTVGRSARHCAAAQTTLDQETQAIFQELFEIATGTLDLTKIGQFAPYQQHLIVREWFQAHGLKMPSAALLETLLEQVIAADMSRDPELRYQGSVIRRFRQRLYCLALNDKTTTTASMTWPAGTTSIQFANQQLSYALAEYGIDCKRWQTAHITVKFRQGGEKISLPGRQGRQSLKKLFQEAAIPTWQRDQMPLIYMDDLLAAVADLWVSREVWVNDSQAIRIEWKRTT